MSAQGSVVLASGHNAGALGFLVIVLLIVATVLLIRSLSTRLGNVRRNAEHWPEDDEQAGSEQT